MLPALAGAEPRLQRRYHQLVVSELSATDRLAAGIHAPPSLTQAFAATQAAWRFYSNPRIDLPTLAQPLVDLARDSAPRCCDHWVLTILDWSNLHYKTHRSKVDRVEMARHDDLGYELLTALAVSDRDGTPIAPLCLELRGQRGVHTTRSSKILQPLSQLDGLDPVMNEVMRQPLGKPMVFIIDREADSVAHYRRWSNEGKKLLIRANGSRWVLHEGKDRRLDPLADALPLTATREVQYHDKTAQQFVGETIVVLNRPAYQHRVIPGRRRNRKMVVIPGPLLPMRLVVAEVRDPTGKRLARWLLLSNLPTQVPASTLALWYHWRWKIESYHKLLKGAGQQLEQWQQETADTLSRRLLVTAMSVVMIWQLARDTHPRAASFRETLVRLSGRQIKRGKTSRGFTEPALLAGLNILVPMLTLLRKMSLEELLSMTRAAFPLLDSG